MNIKAGDYILYKGIAAVVGIVNEEKLIIENAIDTYRKEKKEFSTIELNEYSRKRIAHISEEEYKGIEREYYRYASAVKNMAERVNYYSERKKVG